MEDKNKELSDIKEEIAFIQDYLKVEKEKYNSILKESSVKESDPYYIEFGNNIKRYELELETLKNKEKQFQSPIEPSLVKKQQPFDKKINEIVENEIEKPNELQYFEEKIDKIVDRELHPEKYEMYQLSKESYRELMELFSKSSDMTRQAIINVMAQYQEPNARKILEAMQIIVENKIKKQHEIPEQICGHKFSKEEMDILKSGGRTDMIKGFVSTKTNGIFDASVAFNKDTHKFEFEFDKKQQKEKTQEAAQEYTR